MEPIILDVFTSAKDSPRRKKVFSQGDSIQWNVIHTVDEGDFIGRQYRTYWYIKHWSLAALTWEEPDCEVLFHPLVMVKDDFTYTSEVRHDWWWSTGIASSTDISVPYDGRRETLLRIGGRDPDLMMYLPGFWEFTAYVRMTEGDTGSPFDVLGHWHYLIKPGQS